MATRFRLPASGAAAVTPAFQTWSHTGTTRRPLPTSGVGDSSALTTTAITPDAADHIVAGTTFHAQFVSDKLAAQTIASGITVTLTLQALEANAGNNLVGRFWLGLYNEAGTVLLATLLPFTLGTLELNTTIQNRSGSAPTTAGYTCTGGERLVFEVGVSGTPVATGGVQGHNASLRFGSNGAGGDLPANDTEVGATFNPWLELSANLLFQTPVTFSAALLVATPATLHVADLTASPPLTLPPGAAARYSAINMGSPWRGLMVLPE